MRKYFTFSSFLFLFCVIFLSIGSLSSRYVDLPKMQRTLEAGEKYKIKSKSGSRSYEGDKLRRLIERSRTFSNIFLIIIPLLILCAVGALKWEFHLALVGGGLVVAAHLVGLVMTGWSNYADMAARSGPISMSFSMSILGIFPALYVLYMYHNRLKFHPDVPSTE